MATITGLTAARMQEIEAASVVDGDVVSGNLILTKHDGTQLDAGPVVGPAGPPGPTGPQGLSAIPGEVKLWPSDVLPELAEWGKWVWADGGAYDVATYPVAAGHIAAAWKTFDGASDPGAGKFRVPDLRGLIPAGLDQMPAGARANRMTRTAAITLASRTGKEQHQLVPAEMPGHSHTVNSHSHGGVTTGPNRGNHTHLSRTGKGFMTNSPSNGDIPSYLWGTAGSIAYSDNSTNDAPHDHNITPEAPGTNAQGGNSVHENVQPSVMVPYIVCLGS
jgi:microcystin-dependent protein